MTEHSRTERPGAGRRLTVNGEPHDLPDPPTVAGLMAGREGRGVAVAVNGAVVPRERHAAQPLAPGDVVEIVTAVQGG